MVSGTDLMIDKLLVLDANRRDWVPLLQMARDLREQVDWPEVATHSGNHLMHEHFWPFFVTWIFRTTA